MFTLLIYEEFVVSRFLVLELELSELLVFSCELWTYLTVTMFYTDSQVVLVGTDLTIMRRKMKVTNFEFLFTIFKYG